MKTDKTLVILFLLAVILVILALTIGQDDYPRRRPFESEEHMIWRQERAKFEKYWHEHPELHPKPGK